MTNKIAKTVFLFILLLALFLRLYEIDSVPPSLNWDEISHGYNAYSILKTGKDEWGIKFPLIFRAYGDFKLPVYIYLTVLSEMIFGLSPLAVRLVSVMVGLGLVILSFFISLKVFKREDLSLMAAFLVAVSPWSLFLSRIAVEANLGAFLFALGAYFLLDWFDQRKVIKLISFSVAWGLSLHAYNSARILVPLGSLLLLTYWLRKKQLKALVLSWSILLIFFFPIVPQLLNKSGSARFSWVSLIDQGVISQIIKERTDSHLPATLSKILYNRPSFFIYLAFKNYLANLSPKYLFFRGGSHYQFSLPDHELLYLVTAPFLILGLIKTIKGGFKEKILIVWLFMSFLPSAITKDSPHVLRTILVLPLPMILAAVGVVEVTDFLATRSKFKSLLVPIVVVIAVLISFLRWFNDYLTIYPFSYSWAWQCGYKEAVGFIKENYQHYEKIFVTKRYGEPHEFVLFYFPWDPQFYQNDPKKIWDYHADWYWVDGFDKFRFINDWEVKNVRCSAKGGSDVKCLLVTSPNNYSEGWSKIDSINFLDGKTAFDILEK